MVKIKLLLILFTAAVVLTSCYPPEQKEDGRCLDGYLVYSVAERPVFLGFCRDIEVRNFGMRGIKCYDGPAEGHLVEMNLIVTNGYYGKTSCYNVIGDHQ